MRCTLSHERALWRSGITRVAGIDEAGRGPLAGPVVVAVVVLRDGLRISGLNDSKKLSSQTREELCRKLRARVEHAVSVFSHERVDELNILRATHEAMKEAFARLPEPAHHALIDGLPVPGFPAPHTALVDGDARSMSIAAASIIAKVTRDEIMHDMDTLYPQYGFRQHKGYATPEHLARLREHGPCPIHRRSFEPVAQRYLF